MFCLNLRRVRAVVVGVVCSFVVAPLFAVEDDDDELVVPPGQEELLAQMLGNGATLPEQCKFAGGQADGPIVESTYKCPWGEVVLHLTHSSQAAPAARVTEQFAITVESGSPPDSVTAAVASLVRSGEDGFEWQPRVVEDDVAEDDGAQAGQDSAVDPE